MKNTTHARITYFTFILTLCSLTYLSAQTTDDILEAYENYSEVPREIAYVHLNKSTYIEGEMMGFTAYIFDKSSKEPSTTTTNIYCTISSSDGKVLRQKLVKVNNGVASNVFNIDSTLSTGIFTFKAYTNWMKNFDEQNHFEQTFKIIDADNLEVIKPVSRDAIEVDLQALGEGGHILYNVPNTLGIIAKDQFGYGIANASGSIVDNEGKMVSEFKLNAVGLGKALFTPLPKQSYSVSINANDKTITTPISDIKLHGIIMNVVPAKDKVTVVFKTNAETLQTYRNKRFQLALHNGSKLSLIPVTLDEKGTTVLSFSQDVLFSGMNIFTVFDEEDKPILERLYFNHQNINHQKIDKVSLSPSADSLNISFNFDAIDTSKWSNLSVSVLPSETNAYNHQNSLLSQLYIQPYIKGALEKGAQYFASDTSKTLYNLDVLMLTQGWSSYNWSTIFNAEKTVLKYPFEQGIDIVTNVNKGQNGTFLVYPMSGKGTQVFDIPKDGKSFLIKSVFPNEDDLFKVGIVSKKGALKEAPQLYPQYFPSEFPSFTKSYNTIIDAYKRSDIIDSAIKLDQGWQNVEILEEVVIEAESDLYNRLKRAESLKNKSFNSRVDIISERLKLRGMRIDLYLQRLGYLTDYNIETGDLFIVNPRVRWGNPVPTVYLNGALIGLGPDADFSILTFLFLDEIDYIEYEPYGIGGGLLNGPAGFIKIVTSNSLYFKKKNKNVLGTYSIPLKFSNDKQFYLPKYQYYNTEFFKQYGTIAWEHNLTHDNSGKINFKIADTKTNNITLFVEGVINGNQYISQEIKIERDN